MSDGAEVRSYSLLEVAGLGHDEEFAEDLLAGRGWKLERIVSRGQVSTDWYDQETDEWVLLLAGAARLLIRTLNDEYLNLKTGDAVLLPARCRHRVVWTDPNHPTIWLALHADPT